MVKVASSSGATQSRPGPVATVWLGETAAGTTLSRIGGAFRGSEGEEGESDSAGRDCDTRSEATRRGGC